MKGGIDVIKLLNDWPGKILINDKNVNLTGDFKFTDDMTIKLLPVKMSALTKRLTYITKF